MCTRRARGAWLDRFVVNRNRDLLPEQSVNSKLLFYGGFAMAKLITMLLLEEDK